jgi:hypothetical protein
VHAAVQGQTLKLYEVAKKLSDATGGEVSVAELCETDALEEATVEKSSSESGETPVVDPEKLEGRAAGSCT